MSRSLLLQDHLRLVKGATSSHFVVKASKLQTCKRPTMVSFMDYILDCALTIIANLPSTHSSTHVCEVPFQHPLRYQPPLAIAMALKQYLFYSVHHLCPTQGMSSVITECFTSCRSRKVLERKTLNLQTLDTITGFWNPPDLYTVLHVVAGRFSSQAALRVVSDQI